MMGIRVYVCIAMAVLAFGCIAPRAIPTPYQPLDYEGGYSDTQLDRNVFQVRFHGNKYTPAEVVADYSLLRSTEISLERGFKYFIIVRKVGRSSASTYTYGPQTYFLEAPSAENTILCFEERP